MATIYPAIYNHTQKWTAIVDSSAKDGFFGVDRMIQEGIRQTTNMMTVPQPFDQTAKKIVDLLVSQAERLQGKKSNITNYISDIHRVIKDAESGDVDSIVNRIETLRIAGYQDDQVFPRNRAEVEDLIEAKRSLASLQPIFQFCDRVKKAQETRATSEKIQELIKKSKEFEGIENYQALQSARLTLQNLSHDAMPSDAPLSAELQPAGIDQAPESISYLRWSCSLVYNSACYIGSLSWRVAKSIFNRYS